MSILEIRDNDGDTFDRYTVVYDGIGRNGLYASLGMSDNPFHPQGFGQHGDVQPGPHLGREISFDDLPEDCRRAVLQDLAD